ncbi:MAG TPA: alpha/beta fold hydrolase [Myxococcota bacterium]|nr:alpha/beta fold hydrolase [Myxococcota bacterium]
MRIFEPKAEHRGTLVWMHGLGATCDDFVPVLPMLQRPDLRVVLPQAPDRPVTINGGWVMPAWYDITSLSHGPGRNDPAHIEESRRYIEGLALAEEVPVVLVGFSQGGAMALHTGLAMERALAGIVVLSAYRLEGSVVHRDNAATPIFFGHGELDEVVPIHKGREAAEALSTAGREVTWGSWPMGHEVCLEEIEALRRWLGEVLT